MRNLATAFVFSVLFASSASAMGNYQGAPSIPEPAAAAAFAVGAIVVGFALRRHRVK
jgi:hypothetical protein